MLEPFFPPFMTFHLFQGALTVGYLHNTLYQYIFWSRRTKRELWTTFMTKLRLCDLHYPCQHLPLERDCRGYCCLYCCCQRWHRQEKSAIPRSYQLPSSFRLRSAATSAADPECCPCIVNYIKRGRTTCSWLQISSTMTNSRCVRTTWHRSRAHWNFFDDETQPQRRTAGGRGRWFLVLRTVVPRTLAQN
jgi:hypothetical protein